MAGRFSVSPGIPGCDLSAAFSAGPTAPCWIRWLPTEPGFELIHQAAVFAPATQYTFTLAGGFADLSGDSNDLDHHWDITSAVAPRLTGTTPADRSDSVPLDTPLVVSFSAPMDAPSTAAAITLDPAVPGTRVIRNLVDHGRFAVLPGQLLDPRIAYTLSVQPGAMGEDGNPVVAPSPVHFTTGTRLAGPHAVVLAGPPGGPSTEVLLPALAPQAAGEPPAAPVVMKAPRCALASGCGSSLPPGAPLQTYTGAAVSGDGSHVAVVIHDEQTGTSRLDVVTTIDDTLVADIPGAVRPSWSPDGSQLAMVTASGVTVLDVRQGLTAVVAPGTALAAPPLWSDGSTLVLSSATASGLPDVVELLNRDLDARFPLPAAPPATVASAVSPGGRLAVTTADGAVTVLTGAASPQHLSGRLQPLGFAGEGTLVAISDGSVAQLVRISVLGGDSSTVQLPGNPQLQSVRVAPDGRRLAWLGLDAQGVVEAYVANADGSGALALTRFVGAGLDAQSIAFAS